MNSHNKTQEQLFWESHRKNADANEAFLFLVKEGMTANELKQNIQRNPKLWKRFESWLDKLP